MSSNESKPGHQKIVQFIPYKTMAMDLEAILASLTRIYVSRHDVNMVELISLAQPELFPVGSFDAEAERYEYVLKLAVPVKLHNHLRDNIDTIQPQLLADIATVTAPYLHEFISEVFVVLKIEQDPSWRDAALDWVMEGSDPGAKRDADVLLMYAPADENRIVRELETAFAEKRLKVARHALTSLKDRDIQHALADGEKRARCGVLVVSPALVRLPFDEEVLGELVAHMMNPGKRFTQIWHDLERADVAKWSPALARSLAFTTLRMTVAELRDLLMKSASLGS
jgi:hypothetical protein